MNILILSKKFPYPLKDGETIAIYNLSRSLAKNGAVVTLLAMNTTKHYYEEESLPETLHYFKAVHAVNVDNQLRPLHALWHLLCGQSYHISRFNSTAYGRRLQSLLERESFDIVQLETLYLAPYIPIIRRYTNAKITMRAHNVEHEIWRRITRQERNWIKKYYLTILTRQLYAYEKGHLNAYDLMLAISPKDLHYFRKIGLKQKGIVLPIGIDVTAYLPNYAIFNQLNLTMSFIGSLDWMPNIEGLTWFINDIWEPHQGKFPGLEIHVAGRNTPNWLIQKKIRGLVVHGEVEDAKQFINNHPIMLVPLLSGSGMRAKIIEGMALGRVVVTTSLGLEGIPATHGKEVLVADTPDEFLVIIQDCLAGQYDLLAIGKSSRHFVEKHFDFMQIGNTLLTELDQIL